VATPRQPVGRRTFLQGAAVGAAGIVARPRGAEAVPDPHQGGAASPAAAPERVEVSDQDLTDIYAYLRTVPPAKSPKEIPLLNQLKSPGR
jgi:hypothetical protein